VYAKRNGHEIKVFLSGVCEGSSLTRQIGQPNPIGDEVLALSRAMPRRKKPPVPWNRAANVVAGFSAWFT